MLTPANVMTPTQFAALIRAEVEVYLLHAVHTHNHAALDRLTSALQYLQLLAALGPGHLTH
jgi:hypothetical protein